MGVHAQQHLPSTAKAIEQSEHGANRVLSAAIRIELDRRAVLPDKPNQDGKPQFAPPRLRFCSVEQTAAHVRRIRCVDHVLA